MDSYERFSVALRSGGEKPPGERYSGPRRSTPV